MPVELLLPGRRIPTPEPPERIALNMAFGCTDGTTLGDKSRYRSHGAVTGCLVATGVHGRCLDFIPAFFGRVVIPAAHTQLNFTSEDFSMIIRLITDSVAADRAILIRGKNVTDGYFWDIRTGGRSRFRTWQVAATQTTDTPAGSIAIATWYTLGVSRNGASVRLYINGVDSVFGAGVHIDPVTCARSANIGIMDDLVSGPFDGRIEFFRIFRNIALTASEHLAWHRALA